MELSDTIITREKLKLKSVDRSYELRNFTLEDEIWLKKEYGDKLSEYLNVEALDLDVLCRICYRLIIQKNDFAAREVEIITEDGEIKRERLGGRKMLARMISSEEDKNALIIAVLTTFANSRPMAIEAEQDSKKK